MALASCTSCTSHQLSWCTLGFNALSATESKPDTSQSLNQGRSLDRKTYPRKHCPALLRAKGRCWDLERGTGAPSTGGDSASSSSWANGELDAGDRRAFLGGGKPGDGELNPPGGIVASTFRAWRVVDILMGQPSNRAGAADAEGLARMPV